MLQTHQSYNLEPPKSWFFSTPIRPLNLGSSIRILQTPFNANQTSVLVPALKKVSVVWLLSSSSSSSLFDEAKIACFVMTHVNILWHLGAFLSQLYICSSSSTHRCLFRPLIKSITNMASSFHILLFAIPSLLLLSVNKDAEEGLYGCSGNKDV